MTLRADIATQIGATVEALSESGWTWAARSSAHAAEALTWSATETAIAVHATGLRVEIEPGGDPREIAYELQRVRVADTGAGTLPSVLDRLTDPDGTQWIVTGIISRGPGTRAYEVERAERYTRGPQRGRVR